MKNNNFNETLLYVGYYREKLVVHFLQELEKGLVYTVNSKYTFEIINDILNRIDRLDLSVKVILIIEDIDYFLDNEKYNSIISDISRLKESPSIKLIFTSKSQDILDIIKERIKIENVTVKD